MTGQQLKNSILQWAIQGKLVPQIASEGTAEDLLKEIRAEKEKLVKEGKLKKKDLEVKPIEEDEVPFEVPSSWRWVRLGDVGSWGAGATPSKGNPAFYNKGTIPWLTTGELNNGHVSDSKIYVSDLALQKCSLRLCEIGDVLVAMYGATIGKVAIADARMTTNQACCACTPLKVFNEYLFYFIMASKERLIELGEGGAQPNISREKIVAFPFPLPPLAEQKRIVSKIEELMPLVEQYGKAQEQLEALNKELPEKLKKSVLQEAIMGKLVPQDPKEGTAEELLAEIRKEKEKLVKEGKLKKKDLEVKPIEDDEVPFEVPEGWRWCRIKDISNLVTKGTTPRGGNVAYLDKGIGFLRAENVSNMINLDLTNLKFIDECTHQGYLRRSILCENDFLITIAGSLGRTAIVNGSDLPLNMNQAISVVRFTDVDLVCLKYIAFALNSQILQEILLSQSKITAIPNLTLEIISDCLIPLPPLAEQKRIVAKVEEVMGEIETK